MYTLTLILFAFLSLVFPILAVPVPVPNEIDGLAQRATTARAGTSFTGSGTFFNPGLGACGTTNTNDQLIAAIPTSVFGSGVSAHCGQQVNIASGGKSVQVMVVDKCVGCGSQDIGACQNNGSGVPSTDWVFLSDMSPAAFQQLAALTVGKIQVTWNFV